MDDLNLRANSSQLEETNIRDFKGDELLDKELIALNYLDKAYQHKDNSSK